MTPAQRAAAIAKITAVFQAHAAIARVVLQPVNGLGKLYELWILAHLVDVLVRQGFHVRIVNGNLIYFRQASGPIDRTRSWLEVRRGGKPVGEIMLDVEFQTISFANRTARGIPPPVLTQGDCHELDIALLAPGLPDQSRPKFDQIFLAAECKNTAMNKAFVRNMLGLRRELSFFRGPGTSQNPVLQSWPRRSYSNSPASSLFLFCSDPKVQRYRSITPTFDISLRYMPI